MHVTHIMFCLQGRYVSEYGLNLVSTVVTPLKCFRHSSIGFMCIDCFYFESIKSFKLRCVVLVNFDEVLFCFVFVFVVFFFVFLFLFFCFICVIFAFVCFCFAYLLVCFDISISCVNPKAIITGNNIIYWIKFIFFNKPGKRILDV